MNREKIVQIIKEQYIYFDNLSAELKNDFYKIQYIEDKNIFFKELQILLEKFQDPHTKLIRKMEYILPVTLGIIGNKLVVIEVFETNSIIKKGFILKKINHQSISDLLYKMKNIDSESLKLIRILESISRAHNPQKILLTFETGRGQTVEKNIKYVEAKSLKLDNCLKQKYFALMEEHKKRIEQKYKILYYRCPSLLNDAEVNLFMQSLEKQTKLKSIIFDLRNNMGGKIELAIKITEFFINEKVKIYLKDKRKIHEYVLKPRKSVIRGKNVGVLFNNLTCSSLEFIFLRLVSDNKNILRMGTPTCGMNDIASVYELGDGMRMSLTTKKYVNFNGKEMHIKNIKPQVYIDINHRDVTNNDDIQLEKAIYSSKKREKLF